MLSIAICDDMPEEALALESAIKRALPDTKYQLTAYCNAQKLLAAQTEGHNADILLLDICMPGQDGVSVAQQMNRVSPATQIIFISAHSEYAVNVYEAEHIYFLVKPVQQGRLHAALSCACERIRRQHNMRLALPVRGSGTRILFTSEILYFERQNHLTLAVTTAGDIYTPLKLSDIAALLPAGAFERPHNSYLVNLGKVRSTARMRICMANGSDIPISNQKRATFMRALAESL